VRRLVRFLALERDPTEYATLSARRPHAAPPRSPRARSGLPGDAGQLRHRLAPPTECPLRRKREAYLARLWADDSINYKLE